MKARSWSRRDVIRLGSALGMSPLLSLANDERMLTRPIPASGEPLPVVGFGTYSVFDVSGSAEEIAARRAIVDLLVEKGGSVIDSSPMYNRSERIVGDIVEESSNRDQLFLATKVWTDGRAAGERQMQRSEDLMQAGVVDLMQVHNLRDLDVHMGTIRDWQNAERIRYNGITHYTASAHGAMERAMEEHRPQFIQINYSLGEREADRRLLPLAQDLGIAVLINRPYMAGRLFRAVRNIELPDWAMEFADTWGQFFLKFIISHPAVTCIIPATSKLHHMADNLGAGFGKLPDTATRARMAELFDTL